jgi:hypothetical protein
MDEEKKEMLEKERADFEKALCDVPGLTNIRETPEILSKIKLDVTPQVIMEPRFHSNPEDLRKLREITGYMFYIETQCEPPAIMLMKIGKTDIEITVGKIDEVPRELIQRAIDNPVHKPVFGMYAITDEIKEWLTKELGLK